MGNGVSSPSYINPTIGGNSGYTRANNPFDPFGGQHGGGSQGLPGGGQLEAFAKDLVANGLPADIQANYLKQGQGQIAGNLRSGQQQLNEQLAGSGASIGAGIKGQSMLNQNANQSLNDLTSNLANMNFQAKQTGFGDYSNLIGLAQGNSNAQNQFNFQKYQTDQANSFDFGKVLGDVLQTGGKVASKGMV
jgi:hypothetical protein